MDLSPRLAAVREAIAAAARRAGRDPAEVTLVAVTKSAPPEVFEAARRAGITDVGESRVVEGAARLERYGAGLRRHLVGHLQGNKARRAVAAFDVIHSVDSPELLRRLDALAGELGRAPELLLQVNVAGDARKSGLAPAAVRGAVDAGRLLRHARLVGLMTMAPRVDEAEQARGVFAALAALRDELAERGGQALPELSMGMSEDFTVAVEEGATLVRVGRRLVDPAFAP